jgi:cell division septation protein DedD
MNEIHSTPNLAKSLIQFILSARPIVKTMDVGTGNNSYKAVSDSEVKTKLGKLLAENGLCILPQDIEANESHLETDDKYKPGAKKLTIFTSVKIKYLLLHESGESQVVTGYGHGVDPQDKAAGKATTYALKYLLIYLSLAPTGGLDDSDADHSEEPKTIAPVSRFSTAPPAQAEKKEAPKTDPTKSPAPAPAPKAPAPAPKAPAPAPKAPAPVATTTPAQTQGTVAPAPANGGKWALKIDDEKWDRVVSWVVINKAKGLEFCIESLKKNNEFGADVEQSLADHIGLPF